jgi:hypothetical protein
MRYLAIKNSDIPGAENAAEMMEKLLPPGMIQQEGQPEIPPQVAMQIQQMQMQMKEMQQENLELKSDAAPKMAKVQADSQAKMAEIQANTQSRQQELQVESASTAEELRLSKEKSDAEIALKRAVAEAEHQLKQYELQMEQDLLKRKTAFELDIKKTQCDNDIEIEKRKMAVQEDTKELPTISKNIETGFAKAIETLAKILDENMKLNREVLETMKAPKHITLTKNAQGQPIGADVRTLN